MKKGIGKKLLQAICSMYSKTSYTPKIDKNLVGDPIVTEFGVTQGRKTSGNLYAFAISDMPKSLHDNDPKDFMDPYCMAQLADDTSLMAETIKSQGNKFQKVINFTNEKHQHINTKKTKYMHMSPNPITTPIVLNDNDVINAVEPNEGHNFIGFKLTYSNDIYELVSSNLNSKMFNVAKFYSWLEYNKNTPFFIKLKVLYSCLFAALLNSGEAWGDLSKIENTLRTTETKALKSCLGVKSGTTSDIIYNEINRPDIIAIMMDRQLKFKQKIIELERGEALVKEIWDLCQGQEVPNLCDYYMNLTDNNSTSNINERKTRIETSEQTMCERYRTKIGLSHCPTLYNSCLDDEKRTVITRWRLSSHKLKIETGRYTKPKTEVEYRLCKICFVVEDEHHAIYTCKAHRIIREKYKNNLKLENDNIRKLLNPTTIIEATYLAMFLKEIEMNMSELDMI